MRRHPAVRRDATTVMLFPDQQKGIKRVIHCKIGDEGDGEQRTCEAGDQYFYRSIRSSDHGKVKRLQAGSRMYDSAGISSGLDMVLEM